MSDPQFIFKTILSAQDVLVSGRRKSIPIVVLLYGLCIFTVLPLLFKYVIIPPVVIVNHLLGYLVPILSFLIVLGANCFALYIIASYQRFRPAIPFILLCFFKTFAISSIVSYIITALLPAILLTFLCSCLVLLDHPFKKYFSPKVAGGLDSDYFKHYADTIDPLQKPKIIVVMEAGPRSILLFWMYKQLKEHLQRHNNLKIDMVVATSVGGTIPILDLVGHCYEKNIIHISQNLGPLFGMWNTRKYSNINEPFNLDTSPIPENILDRSLPGQQSKIKVAIVAATKDKRDKIIRPFLFKNYHEQPMSDDGKTPLIQGTHSSMRFALEACWSIPSYRKPILAINGSDIIEGSIIAANPLEIALHEAKLMFPNNPLYIYSLGTGRKPPHEKNALETYSDSVEGPQEMNGTIDDLYRLIMVPHLRFQAWINRVGAGKIKYHRIEPDLPDIALDDPELQVKMYQSRIQMSITVAMSMIPVPFIYD
ncbi:hypothetical protein DFA_07685 [Cavenderia fasciculata]|uniref:PNPLA domain-containing protein n=1 Tax=Cavenderia fasciculata TaxID=261658 RepID=F4Q2T1_CACFS|nr:uncharacterized protein DFA_07685 [Cavenderia fasciculata]EGG16707.1 hypothetical protein DFA_07685 [Cavenderia fasciculata]|eukprot:XP_004355181.1 hypothetical protein DFA_07685 [Cavenderia fasciculata]